MLLQRQHENETSKISENYEHLPKSTAFTLRAVKPAMNRFKIRTQSFNNFKKNVP